MRLSKDQLTIYDRDGFLVLPELFSPREVEAMIESCGYVIERCLTPRPAWYARLWPRLFSHDLVYVLRPSARPAAVAA